MWLNLAFMEEIVFYIEHLRIAYRIIRAFGKDTTLYLE